jgi:hypothetical protein
MRPVANMPRGQTTAYVADINGFLVALCTPMALSSIAQVAI